MLRGPRGRFVSLLPSATEILGGLGLAQHVVGVTHECDVCPDNKGLDAILAPRGSCLRVTTSEINPHTMGQGEIDDRVKESIRSGLSLYTVEEDLLRQTRPTHVFTQALCAVCAPATGEVEAVCRRLGDVLGVGSSTAGGAGGASATKAPVVINLEPNNLEDVVTTFSVIAEHCGCPERGVALESKFRNEMALLTEAVSKDAKASTSVLLLEWLEPPFDGGHWVPDLIRAAGCAPALNPEGGKSSGITWEAVMAADPDVIVVACCGFGLERNIADARRWLDVPGSMLAQTRAARSGRIFALDGNRYYARPSQSLSAGAAIIARCAHDVTPEVVAKLKLLPHLPAEDVAWSRVPLHPHQSTESVVNTNGSAGNPLDASAAGGVGAATAASAGVGSESGRNVESLVMKRYFEAAGLPSAAESVPINYSGVSGAGSSSMECGGGSIDLAENALSCANSELGDIEDWGSVHSKACNAGEDTYRDPDTGYSVFTQFAHQNRGKCCGRGCRHCAFNHRNVPDGNRAARIQQPAWLLRPSTASTAPSDAGGGSAGANGSGGSGVHVLFYSGGKHSVLALRALVASGVPTSRVVLLTTFSAETRKIPIQNVAVDDVMKQAAHLGFGLLGIPLPLLDRRTGGDGDGGAAHGRARAADYVARVENGLAYLSAEAGDIACLVFGDAPGSTTALCTSATATISTATTTIATTTEHGSRQAAMQVVRQWRERVWGSKYELEFPLWEGRSDTSMVAELEQAGVACVDAVGGVGEGKGSHTLAHCLEVPRRVVLGL